MTGDLETERTTAATDTMQAVVQRAYGSPDLLRLENVAKPSPLANQVLVRVRASSVNALDWYGSAGQPYIARPLSGLRRPRETSFGSDFAGTVEAVGEQVKRFRPGDSVFGVKTGAYAQYLCVAETGPVAAMPANAKFADAAAVPLAGLTALQAARDKARIAPGQRVLVNGASGGVGTFTVQVAKSLGAEVTAVCSSRNVEMVRSLGADRVIDYTRQDFSATGDRYDAMIDIAGSRPWSACRQVLVADGTYVLVGACTSNRWLGPLGHIAGQRLASLGATQKFVFFIASTVQPDLIALAGLMEDGKLRPVIDRVYPVSEAGQALTWFKREHARGKIVIQVD